MKNRLLSLIMMVVVCATLTGCGEDPELTKFKNEMDSFCNTIVEIDAAINNIDATSESAKEDLLDQLDKTNDTFRKLANISIPEEFSYLSDLTKEASSDMSEAVALYHEAFSNNSFNEYTFDYATEYYKRAYTRLTYIISLLHGEIPDTDDIIIYEDQSE